MQTIIATLAIGGGAMVLAFGLIGIRNVLQQKEGFRGTCSSNNPMLADSNGTCSVCGGDYQKCENKETAKD